MSLKMSKSEREAFLADVHVAVISVADEARGPLTVPIWYSYTPGGDVCIITDRSSRKGGLLERAGRFTQRTPNAVAGRDDQHQPASRPSPCA